MSRGTVTLNGYNLSQRATAIVTRNGDVAEIIFGLTYVGAEISRKLVITGDDGDPVYYAKTERNEVVKPPCASSDPILDVMYQHDVDPGVEQALSPYADLADVSPMRALSHFIVLADEAKFLSFGRANYTPAVWVANIYVPTRLRANAPAGEVAQYMLGS